MLAKSWFFLAIASLPAALSLSAGCGGSGPPAASAEPASASTQSEADNDGSAAGREAATKPSEESGPVPTECHRGTDPCLPNPNFVKKLCNSRNPSMALYLFANGSKWTRRYLTRKTEAWNASGGASAGGFVEFDEEVLLLFERKAAADGMQVSGAGGGYDALRWDGSCVTLSTEEVTSNEPPAAKTPKLEWRFLDDNVQEALRKDEKVNAAYLERRKECKGAVSGDVSLPCVKADTKLSNAIIAFVRGGGAVPLPTTLPE